MEDADVRLPGGRNLSLALDYYRQVASAGQLPTRYNIGWGSKLPGVLLLQSLTNGSGATLPENLSLADCHEIRWEFAEARDMDPTVRLLFALAMRLPTANQVTKAHRNAALFWEERTGSAWDAAGQQDVNATDVDEDAGRCNATEDVTVELVATGRFCCNGERGEEACDDFLFNEPGYMPAECGFIGCAVKQTKRFCRQRAKAYLEIPNVLQRSVIQQTPAEMLQGEYGMNLGKSMGVPAPCIEPGLLTTLAQWRHVLLAHGQTDVSSEDASGQFLQLSGAVLPPPWVLPPAASGAQRWRL
ncbi:hypothetical protein AK812_SmicGene21121 [Symbiodinium microadriaticum]|uniref:Uncharacterized protein n=1 Tax=Symbiodinium microadriaticum TaxID=2951 RepID=A0A1Q9DNA3_SYMMI|nr:hypothetical protein AK812_SmicGene21121 [Symbiodinium microadriaticum]